MRTCRGSRQSMTQNPPDPMDDSNVEDHPSDPEAEKPKKKKTRRAGVAVRNRYNNAIARQVHSEFGQQMQDEVYGSDDAQGRFIQDFIVAWNKVMNADRFDLN